MEGASNVITYVNDVLKHSATHEAHIAHLRHAIQRTHKAGLALNPKKCIFGLTTVEYLGHTILLDRVSPGKDKTQAVKEITEPRTMKQLKICIGLVNYFRTYVKDFASVASNLHALRKQNTKWKEADGLPKRSKEAFKAIKAAISSRPVGVPEQQRQVSPVRRRSTRRQQGRRRTRRSTVAGGRTRNQTSQDMHQED
jgi:hypothetical protein